jgi:hypothetical protein
MAPWITRIAAAVAVTAAALTAAPAAHAGWVTGAGTPPITDGSACRNAMTWSYATYLDDGTNPPAVTLYDVAVTVSTPDADPYADSPQRQDLDQEILASGTYTVPRRSLWVDPATIGGSITDWGGRVPGTFDYYGVFNISFNRRISADEDVIVQWRTSPGGPYSRFRAPVYDVASCYLIAPPSTSSSSGPSREFRQWLGGGAPLG